MTDREILYKAYEKAYKDNFDTDVFEHDMLEYCGDGSLFEEQYLRDIFSHDFAKAFWGEEKIFCSIKLIRAGEVTDSESMLEYRGWGGQVDYYQLPAWQYHLQKMVLETNRLKYIEKFL